MLLEGRSRRRIRGCGRCRNGVGGRRRGSRGWVCDAGDAGRLLGRRGGSGGLGLRGRRMQRG